MSDCTSRRIQAALLSILAVAAMVLGLAPASAQADGLGGPPGAGRAKAGAHHFMVYYRAWRDKTMKGVNTDIPDDNWITMYDIPYGVDIVNVFSYVPPGQEQKAQPFYDTLKSSYAPYLHSRGIKLVRGLGYSSLLDVPHAGARPTKEECESYARQLVSEKVTSLGLDGLDIDMEDHPDAGQAAVSDMMIRALSHHLGPAARNGTMLIYDTNASYLQPFANVADCFDYVSYQQYGSRSDRTARALQDYAPFVGAGRFMPGLAFPEEGDMNNRWLDATEPYASSNLYDVASYAHDHGLAGMFLYALDRDGRTYDDHDLHHIEPSSLLWTKTAIAQASGMSLEQERELARHFLDRHAYGKPVQKDLRQRIAHASSLYEVNKTILGPDYSSAYSHDFDPRLEEGLTAIDLRELYGLLGRADALIEGEDPSDGRLRDARRRAVDVLGARTYTAAEVGQAAEALRAALGSAENAKGPVAGPADPHGAGYAAKTRRSSAPPAGSLAAAGSASSPLLLAIAAALTIALPTLGLVRRRR